jgi:hypothetical protein
MSNIYEKNLKIENTIEKNLGKALNTKGLAAIKDRRNKGGASN